MYLLDAFKSPNKLAKLTCELRSPGFHGRLYANKENTERIAAVSAHGGLSQTRPRPSSAFASHINCVDEQK